MRSCIGRLRDYRSCDLGITEDAKNISTRDTSIDSTSAEEAFI